jgi:uncharacterized protein YecE (DUF72 family)
LTASRSARPRRPSSGRSRIGCSGWQYRSWKSRFYPTELRQSDWLSHYVTRFDTVEVNRTFYRLPESATFAAWRRATPAGFVMAVKASRYLTHLKRLKDPADPVARLFDRAVALGAKLGPVLYQLPAALAFDEGRLREFLDALPRRRTLRHVVEFRHPSWYRDDVFGWLADAGVALCLHDKAGSAILDGPTSPFVYLRFHGTSGQYHGSYSASALGHWAGRIHGWTGRGTDVYAYFNNDPDAAAPSNALTLKRLLNEADG